MGVANARVAYLLPPFMGLKIWNFLCYIYSPFGSYGPKDIAKFNKKVFLGHPNIYDNPDKQDDDYEKVSGNNNLDDENCDLTNISSCSRQPCKQGSAFESIERTAWRYLPVSSCPTVVHWLSGWYSNTWQAKMISLLLSSSYCKPTSSTIQGNFQIITSDL